MRARSKSNTARDLVFRNLLFAILAGEPAPPRLTVRQIAQHLGLSRSTVQDGIVWARPLLRAIKDRCPSEESEADRETRIIRNLKRRRRKSARIDEN